MRKFIGLHKLPVFLLAGLLQGCFNCTEEVELTVIEPVYMTEDEFINSIESSSPKALESTGKIYTKDSMLYINEPNKGIHVVDNKDPYSPEVLAFINIPGNTELAMRNNHLLVNSGPDLLRIDVSEPMAVKLVSRMPNVFEMNVPEDLLPSNGYYRVEDTDATMGRLIGYEARMEKTEVECR